jgi:hypothetical protein
MNQEKLGKILEGTKILLICPGYHNYISTISNGFKNIGAYVENYKSDPSSIFYRNFYLSRLRRFKIFDGFYEKQIVKHNNAILESIRGKDFHHVIIVKGRLITNDFLIKVRSQMPNANLVLYQWDSIKNFNYLDKIKFFDSVCSFDYSDCLNNKNIRYLPLFFSNEYYRISLINHIDYKFDLFFIGYNHSVRIKKLNDIARFCDEKGLKYSFNIMTSISEKLKLILKKSKIKSFFVSLRFDQFSEDYIRSKAIIDISSPTQTGLPFRIIEAIGANKKIVTTNKNVTKESFYDPKMIFIWGKDNPDNLINFLNQRHERKAFKQYSVEAFALNLISQIEQESKIEEK